MKWFRTNATILVLERPRARDRYGTPTFMPIWRDVECEYRRSSRVISDAHGKAIAIDARIAYWSEDGDRILVGDRVTVEPMDSRTKEVYNVVQARDVHDHAGRAAYRTCDLEKVESSS